MLPKFQTFIGLCAFFFVTDSWAQQTHQSIEKNRKSWSFDIRWKDQNMKRQTVAFTLPAARIQHDLSVPLRFQKRSANVEIVRALNEYGKTFENVDLRAKITTLAAERDFWMEKYRSSSASSSSTVPPPVIQPHCPPSRPPQELMNLKPPGSK